MDESWDLGEWSECSRRCGPGTQHRQVICRQVTHVNSNGTAISVTVAPELCGLFDRPVIRSTCQLKICSQWEVRSEWSLVSEHNSYCPFLQNDQKRKINQTSPTSAPQCSVPCGIGQQHREVVCVSNQGDVENNEECNTNLKPESLQNCDMGACARSWFTSLWSQRVTHKCVVYMHVHEVEFS